MAATVLNSERAIQMSVYVVRAFVEFKKSQDANVKVTRRLEALERSVSARRRYPQAVRSGLRSHSQSHEFSASEELIRDQWRAEGIKRLSVQDHNL